MTLDDVLDAAYLMCPFAATIILVELMALFSPVLNLQVPPPGYTLGTLNDAKMTMLTTEIVCFFGTLVSWQFALGHFIRRREHRRVPKL